MPSSSTRGFKRVLKLTKPELARLFQSIGSESRLSEIVLRFYEKMQNDTMIGFFFAGKNLAHIAAKQTQFLLRAFGERPTYSGKAPAEAHGALPSILSGHFDRRLRILEAHLAAEGLNEKDIRTWVTFEEAFREGVVSDPSAKKVNVQIQISDPDFSPGILVARGVLVTETPAPLQEMLDNWIAEFASRSEWPTESRKSATRALLRRGGFSPSGRSKPCSEYLAAASRDSRFPRINNLVDIVNMLCLKYGVPISMLDLEKTGDDLSFRYGSPGEKYVFNAGGQEIDLKGLLCICGNQGQPLGNPVKDSMAGKVGEHTQDVIAVIYAARDAIPADELATLLEEFSTLLEKFGNPYGKSPRVTRI
jgi:DNA/RNA-binding domain of Phe-tRNA-synthetase-like protein/truncated hemoglobin YjbI